MVKANVTKVGGGIYLFTYILGTLQRAQLGDRRPLMVETATVLCILAQEGLAIGTISNQDVALFCGKGKGLPWIHVGFQGQNSLERESHTRH